MNQFAAILAILLLILVISTVSVIVTSDNTDVQPQEFTFKSEGTHPPDNSMFLIVKTPYVTPTNTNIPVPTPTTDFILYTKEYLKRSVDRQKKWDEHIRRIKEKWYSTPTPRPDYINIGEDNYRVASGSYAMVSYNPVKDYVFAEIDEVTLTFKGVMKIDRMWFTDDGTVVRLKK